MKHLSPSLLFPVLRKWSTRFSLVMLFASGALASGVVVGDAAVGDAAVGSMPPPRSTAGAGGVPIQFRLYGTAGAERPIVVLVHGWSCDASYWREQIAALTADYTVVTLDLAGHGSSGGGREDFSMQSFGEDVQRVVDALPSKAPVILVGHSMGGPVAVEAARRLGERVKAVIGVDTFSSIGLPAAPAAETEARIAFFLKDFAASTRMFVDRSFFRPDANADLRRWIVEDMAQGDPRVGVAAVRSLNAWDGVTGLRALKVPVVAINADLAPTDEARIRALSPNFRLVVVPGLGHFLMMEDPARFNSVLREQIAGLL